MLDQSFSKDNFKTIFDISNRNGLFLEDKLNLTSIRKYTNDIKKYSALSKAYNKKGNKILATFFNEAKDQVRKDRNHEIDSVLEQISHNIGKNKFKIALKIIQIPGAKDLYTINNIPEHFFAIKQVQYNISKLFGVKQSNRNSIVQQLISLLSNKFPKTLIRTDISNFYESIDHSSILDIINQSNLLSPKSRKIIQQILRSYKNLSGNSLGLPRGIGISAYLAELYMRKVDKIIKAIPGVIFYARFVDDIVILFVNNPNDQFRNYLEEVKKSIEENRNISINSAKTFQKNIIDATLHSFEFLGYTFKVKDGKVKTKLTPRKVNKIISRIESSFLNYSNLSIVDEKLARSLLVKRIRFLTGNTRLANNKSQILIGIYYSNSFLTETAQITHLDNILKGHIRSLSSNSLKARLTKYEFIEGFANRRFSTYTGKQLKEIMKIWN